MSTLDSMQLLELRIKKAAFLIEMLRKEKAALQEKFDLVKTHNAELEEYVESFTQSNKIVEESIASALDTLSGIEGLDDVDLFDTLSAQELEEAESYTTQDGVTIDEIELDEEPELADDALDSLDDLGDLPPL
ncbi:MAG: hypothetical protein SPD11_00155 [Sphaerochaetaceae bacterium]|nr:hypothetical protein [Sphaerochaetaceae bacterium]